MAALTVPPTVVATPTAQTAVTTATTAAHSRRARAGESVAVGDEAWWWREEIMGRSGVLRWPARAGRLRERSSPRQGIVKTAHPAGTGAVPTIAAPCGTGPPAGTFRAVSTLTALTVGIPVLQSAVSGSLVRQSSLDPDLVAACGESPNLVCEWAFDASDGNRAVAEVLNWLVGIPLAILLILLGAWIVGRVAKRLLLRGIRRIMGPDRKTPQQRLQQIGLALDQPDLDPDEAARIAHRRTARAESVASVVGSTVTVVVWTIAVILVLGEVGLNLGPFIAGAGIVGVALGFGAQSLVKDCITGLFMLMEDQYGIGDVVDLGEAVGTVEEIALRTTVLRGLDGTVWHVPNGEIARVGNKSQLWSTALVDVDVAYDADLTQVREVLLGTAHEICRDEAWSDRVLEEPEILGVETLGADGITLRMIVKTAPGAQWALQRALREGFKHALDEAGVEIPFPQRTVWMRNGES